MPRSARIAVIIVLVLLAGFGFGFATDAAFGAPKASAATNPTARELSCAYSYRCDSADDYARHFRNGRLRNSRYREFNDRIKGMVRVWYKNHPKAACAHGYRRCGSTTAVRMSADGPWWDDIFHASTCVMWGGDRNTCLVRNTRDTNRKFNIIKSQTTRIVMKCGGAAILGAMGGRLDSGKVGWWGAGAGAGSCMYQHVGTRMKWF